MGRRIKLLFVIENSAYGGGEKTFSLLINGLYGDKFDIYCAALPLGRFYEETREHSHFMPLDLTRQFNFANISRLKRIMLDNNIEIAHSQGARADFYCALAAESAGVPAVSTVATPVETFEVNWLRKRIYLAMNAYAERRTAAFITLGRYLKEFYVEHHGIPENRVDVIPNPAVLETAAVAAGPAEKNTDGIILASLGRLECQKGFDILLEALELISRREPTAFSRLNCVIAGTGSLETELKRLAERKDLHGKVTFAGFRYDAGAFLAASDIFVMPSRSEGQPLVLLEAMAVGKPVIAADLPGVKEIVVDGVNGRLFRTGDPGSLADTIISVVAAPEKSFAMTRAAAETVKEFSLEAFLRRHTEFYQKLAKGV